MTTWPTVELGQVAHVVMGQAPPGSTYNTDGEGLPLIAGAGDFGADGISPKKFTSKPTRTCQAGDIVLSIRASIGDKVWADDAYCVGRGVAALRSTEAVEAQFLWHLLSHVEPDLSARARGATFRQVNREDIESLPVPLPPLEEQRRIADVLDRADALRAKRRAAIALLDTLPKALFRQMFGSVAQADASYGTKRLGGLAETSSGSTPTRSRAEYFDGPIPWVKSGELKGDEVLGTEERVSEQALSDFPMQKLDPGTVLVAMYGATAGEVSVLGIEGATNQAICAVSVVGSELRNRYLADYLSESTTTLKLMARGGAQPNLSQGMIRSLDIAVPPLDLQDKYGDMRQAVRVLKDRHVDALGQLDELFASLQQRAFRGEL